MQSTIDIAGNKFEFVVLRAAATNTPEGGVMLPHPGGSLFLAICKRCGFAVLGKTEEECIVFLTETYAVTESAHHHDSRQYVHAQFDPDLIDHIYEAYNLDIERA